MNSLLQGARALRRRANIHWSQLLLAFFAGIIVTEGERIWWEIAPGPFIEADVQIARNDGELAFEYRTWASTPRDAVWRAAIYSEDGARLATRRGQGAYPNERSVVWTWDAFFYGYSTIAPAVPDEPFRVCVDYQVHLPGDVIRWTDRYCSDFFDPRGME